MNNFLNNLTNSILEAVFANPKTSAAAIVGCLAYLLATFGLNMPVEVREGIIATTVWIALLLSKDGDRPKN